MEQRNVYQAPKAELDIVAPAQGRLPACLRAGLTFIFGVYAFFSILFTLFALIATAQAATPRTVTNVLTIACMAYFASRAFLSLRARQPVALKYALLLFVFGFLCTLVYRLAFVVNAPDFTDLANFLIFGIPAALAIWYARLVRG